MFLILPTYYRFIHASFFSGICQHECTRFCASGQFLRSEVDGIGNSGSSWITCQHSSIGKLEDTRKDVPGKQSIQGFPSPHCLVVISQLNDKKQVSSPLTVFGTAVGTAMTRWTIALKCSYEYGASYQWWRLGKNGYAELPISNQAVLHYTVDRKEKLWSIFSLKGLSFFVKLQHCSGVATTQ